MDKVSLFRKEDQNRWKIITPITANSMENFPYIDTVRKLHAMQDIFLVRRGCHLESFSGTVETGIGKASIEMSNSNGLRDWEMLAGMKILPGTLNLHLEKPFDLSLLKYLSFSKIGWDFDPSTQGSDFKGDVGMYYHLIKIFGKYPGILAFWNWAPEFDTCAELISSIHLRTTFELKDGDIVDFSLTED